MIYCLDTNVVVRALRGRGATIEEHLRREGPDAILVPQMVRAELLYGAKVSDRPERHRELVEKFLQPFEPLPFGKEAAEHYADIRAVLREAGTPIGPTDLVIAATARAAGATLVTGNMKEFERVPALRCEDW